MAIALQADEETLNSIIKRSSIGVKPKEKTEVLTEKSVVRVSNTITSLQNAFNKIYTYTLNVKNIHKMEEKRLQNIKKEVTMETKTSTASLAGGAAIDIGNLPDLFKQLTKSVEELTKQFDKLDMSSDTCDSGGADSGVDDDDFDRRRRRRGARRGTRRGGTRTRRVPGRGARVPRGRLGFGGRFLLGIGLDMGAGAFGVGQGFDEAALAAQDEENWNRASTLEKIQSSIPRGIETIGNLFGLSNISSQARADRIKDETEYLTRTRGGGSNTSERNLQQAASRVTQQQAKLETGAPPGSTSFSSRFADYLNQSISNMTTWAMSASPMIAALMAGTGFLGGVFGDYISPDGAGSTANAETAMQYFISQGWTRSQAAGIVGNLQGESGANLNPNALRENDAGAGLHSYGIAQWNRGRWTGLQAFAQSRGMPWNNFETQLAYVQHELMNSERTVGQDLRGAQDAASAAAIMSRYERYRGYQLGIASPETRKRIANANALFQGGGMAASGTVVRSGTTTRRISGAFGERRSRHLHGGIDIPGTVGEPIASLQAGSVIFAGMGTPGSGYNDYGNVVHIRQDNGYEALYAHLHRISPGVRQGTRIQAAQIVGELGNTGRSSGPHLHFEIRRGNAKLDPTAVYNRNPWIVGGTATPVQTAAALFGPVADVQRRRANPDAFAGAPYARNTRNRDLPIFLGGQQQSTPPGAGWFGRDAWRRAQTR